MPFRQLTSPLPLTATFPLLAASVASFKTDIADPIRYLQCQSSDLLHSLCELKEAPSADISLSKVPYALLEKIQSDRS